MKYLRSAFVVVLTVFSVNVATPAQTANSDGKVYGRSYKIPQVRVYLTDEETGGPFAEKDVAAKYCWGWDVIRSTPETDRMTNIECSTVKLRTDATGVVDLPSLLMSPWRPIAPPGSEFSEPRFKYAGMVVIDAKHNTYMSVFDAEVNLLDDKGEVRRTVMLYPRPKPKA